MWASAWLQRGSLWNQTSFFPAGMTVYPCESLRAYCRDMPIQVLSGTSAEMWINNYNCCYRIDRPQPWQTHAWSQLRSHSLLKWLCINATVLSKTNTEFQSDFFCVRWESRQHCNSIPSLPYTFALWAGPKVQNMQVFFWPALQMTQADTVCVWVCIFNRKASSIETN